MDFPEFACTFVGWILDTNEDDEATGAAEHPPIPPGVSTDEMHLSPRGAAAVGAVEVEAVPSVMDIPIE